jgi:hypothetical protein
LAFTEVPKVVIIWKMYWPSGLVIPFSVRVVESVAPEVGKVYTPGANVRPPRSEDVRATVGTRPFASLYAVRQAASALHAAVPPADVVPVHTPGGKPVMAVPGQVPQSPVMTVLPVLVKVVAAIAPKVLASPSKIGGDRFSMEGYAREMEMY